ncbi:MAG: polysaccharide biosynthesis protein [Gemmatimonadaceae bacterium]|nr:polysaccharide biosynthesis protein [Gemmatimonadaceae bacterium]
MTSFVDRIPALRNRAFFVSDLILLPLCVIAAFKARYEGAWSPDVVDLMRTFMATSVPLKFIALISFGLYRRLWRYASISDVEMLVGTATVCAIIDGVVGVVVLPALSLTPGRISYAVVLLTACLSAVAITLPRLGMRILRRRDRKSRHLGSRRAIVVGAGAAGGMIVKELAENPQLGIAPIALLDDDPRKHRLRLHNVPVLGALRDLETVAAGVGATDIVIAMPSAAGRTIREVVRQASEAGLATRTVPGLYEILSGEKRVNALRQIEIQDLLRREPIKTDIAQVASLVKGRTVMVTGAGGSIGSELCRQLARLDPERIIALGRGENSIFELLQEFARTFPKVRIEPVIADVRDFTRMAQVISTYRPYSVFHAAAHKHVPLMEANVVEAVLNNVLGTKNVVTLCAANDVEHFVLISTDKAVRPTSVMGATKRIAEHLVHQCAIERTSGYVAVRFGNVLGSRGSVVPTFMRQIADGGPVTITHPDMVRFFMTIPEAVQLVLQAAALGDQGEVFVLDMGEPVRVYDLALDLIRLSGLEPDVDIEVRLTGTRPGEKLYEELFFQGAHVVPTIHPKILRARDAEASEHSMSDIDALIEAAREGRPASKIRRLILQLVPEYAGVLDTGEFHIGDRTGPEPEVDEEPELVADDVDAEAQTPVEAALATTSPGRGITGR